VLHRLDSQKNEETPKTASTKLVIITFPFSPEFFQRVGKFSGIHPVADTSYVSLAIYTIYGNFHLTEGQSQESRT